MSQYNFLDCNYFTKDNLDKVKADINLLKGYYELIM